MKYYLSILIVLVLAFCVVPCLREAIAVSGVLILMLAAFMKNRIQKFLVPIVLMLFQQKKQHCLKANDSIMEKRWVRFCPTF